MPPSELDASIAAGHYARKQLLCDDRLIAWSHRRRFAMALRLAEQLRGARVLDHGCGDGTFLAMLMDAPFAPDAAVGSEIAPSLVEDCATRLGTRAGLGFLLASALDTDAHAGAYDVVFCTEVLEHVVELDAEIDRLARLVAPSGTLVVSVPVETGLPLVVKQAARRIAGWRGLGDYPGSSPYSAREYWRSVLAGPRARLERPIHAGDDGHRFHDHKGFNWMALRDRLRRRFRVEAVLASPLSWLPAHLGSQAWFVARPSPSSVRPS
jgi:SAM-dependent methyltransferase